MAFDARKALYQGTTSGGERVERPLSPHLGIYRFRLSMALSIGNRIAGVVSSLGLVSVAGWLGALATGPRAFGRTQRVMGSPVGRAVLAGWCVASVYHAIAGARHLIWDAGYRFDRKLIDSDGRRSLILTAIGSLAVLGGLAIRAGSHRSRCPAGDDGALS